MQKKFERFWNNLEKGIFVGAGKYDIPILRPEKYKPVKYIDFTRATGCRDYEGKGVHFFVDDYQFERIWTKFERNMNMLVKFDAVLTPDWSLYTDWPVAVQIWNHYRKHYIGKHLQRMGVTVYPTICWSDKKSFDWCFDGEPVGGCVAVSSVGTQLRKGAKEAFMLGYDAMLERLEPETIIFYGKPPDGCRGNIVVVDEFQKRLRKIVMGENKGDEVDVLD